MKTEFLPALDGLDRAAELIRQGGLVGFPTETVYGLGADALNAEAVLEIFRAKGRPADNPLIVHIQTWEELSPLVAQIPPRAEILARAFWPGPLTMILPKAPLVPDATSAGLSTVAVRMPSHPVAAALIRLSGRPIAAPSGNLSGRPSPTTARHMLQDMDGRIPLILDGGPCQVGVESTVIDLSGPQPTLLRPGGVTLPMLEDALGEKVPLGKGVMEPLSEGEIARSPGLKHRHYAPRAGVLIVRGGREKAFAAMCALYDRELAKKPVVLCPPEDFHLFGGRRCLPCGSDADPAQAAHDLFAALRRVDDEGFGVVLFHAVPTEGVGLAVMNRALRAAAFSVLDADADEPLR